jgi:hypothetical protein
MGLAMTPVPADVAPAPTIENDVCEWHNQQFQMPIFVDANQRDRVKQIRAFVSEDRGKTWRHLSNHEPTDTAVKFTAAKDGLYWFAVQVVAKDGGIQPQKTENLEPAMKVYVNTERRALARVPAERIDLKPDRSREDLQREVAELRQTVAELKKKIAEMEKQRGRD